MYDNLIEKCLGLVEGTKYVSTDIEKILVSDSLFENLHTRWLSHNNHKTMGSLSLFDVVIEKHKF